MMGTKVHSLLVPCHSSRKNLLLTLPSGMGGNGSRYLSLHVTPCHSARAFYENKLVSEFVKHFLNKDISRTLSDQERIKVKRALRGVRVEVRHGDSMRRYKCQDLTPQPVNQLTFVDDTGGKIFVVQYFRAKYNTTLHYPLLPAIQSGTEAKPTYLPMELCTSSFGQRYASNLNEKQVTNLLRATCQCPSEREGSIMTTMQSNKYNNDALVNNEFGMRVREQFTSIDGVLPPPPVEPTSSFIKT